jgi:hypothetical protein
MKKIGIVSLVLALTACGKAAPTDTVESLAANPERLKEIQRLCKEDSVKMGKACNAASEAFRRRFMEDGKGQYAPAPAAQN